MKKMKKGTLNLLTMLTLMFNADAATEKDIPYYPEGSGLDDYQKSCCKLDIKWPAGRKGFKTVVWFHGGGLVKGNKHFVEISDSIAQVAVNYRLMSSTNNVRGAQCIRDAAAAVCWTLENIGKYGGDPSAVYVSGMSGGGYLTMMVGMAPQFMKEFNHDIMELAGIIPISGQATTHFNVRKYSGDNDSSYVPKIDDLAPLAYCSKNIPPILSTCGEPPWEWPGRSEENRLLIASCVALGHRKAWFVTTPYANHQQAYSTGLPYLELFVWGKLPKPILEQQNPQ